MSHLTFYAVGIPLFVAFLLTPVAALGVDCNSNGFDDLAEIAAGTANDCNSNSIPDTCDLTATSATDLNSNSIPDGCERIVFVDDDASGIGDGSSWNDAVVHLQDALQMARDDSSILEILVAEGVYTPDRGAGQTLLDIRAVFELVSNVSVRGGYGGVASSSPNARSFRDHPTILSGDLTSNDVPNLVEGIWCFSRDGFPYASGCDLFDIDLDGDVDESDLQIDDNSIRMLFADNLGQPILLEGVTITAAAGTFELQGAGLVISDSTVVVRHCQFVANFGSLHGTSVFASGSNLTVANCFFSGNRSRSNAQAGIRCENCTLNLARSEFVRNRSLAGTALGLVGGIGQIHNCRFEFNQTTTSNRGGAVSLAGSGDYSIANCLFIGNQANQGGAIDLFGGPHAEIHQCTFSGNLAWSGRGGAIWVQAADLDLAQSIVWNNAGTQIDQTSSSIVALNNNIIQHGWLDAGTNNLDVDPFFLDPIGPDAVPNSGDEDYRLARGSFAIDGGTNALLPLDVLDLDKDGDLSESIPFDLDGNSRVAPLCPNSPARVDLGAFEAAALDAIDAESDTDGDGVANCEDNCIGHPNPQQLDCDGTGNGDVCEIAAGLTADCNSSGIPDGCELAAGTAHDCNANGVVDSCDMSAGTSADCNTNSVPDECEIAAGTNVDLNGNGQLDICENADCNNNAIADYFDIAMGTSMDCNRDGVPDACITSRLWADAFDAYPTGSEVIDQDGGWAGWDANTNAGALVTSAFARSGANSLAVVGTSDVVRSFDSVLTGKLEVTAWQFIPSDHAGVTDFILLFKYNDGGPYGWLVEMAFDSNDSTVSLLQTNGLFPEFTSLSLVTDQWVELRIVIDPDLGLMTIFYDGVFLARSALSSFGNQPRLELKTINLFANDSSVVYYDDLSVARLNTRDCQSNGIPDTCEIAAGSATDANTNGHIDACERVIYVDEDATGVEDGSTWGHAYVHLQDALADANTGPGFAEIRVAGGTYKPDAGGGRVAGDLVAHFAVVSDLTLQGGYAGAGHPNPDVRNIALYETRLTGDLLGDDDPENPIRLDNSTALIVMYEMVDRLVIDGITLDGAGGNFSLSTGAPAIYVGGKHAIVSNCTVRDNIGFNSGGAIGCDNGGLLQLRNCRLLNNTVTGSPAHGFGGNGGAIYVSSSSANIANSLFSGNTARRGGGIACIDAESVIVSGCTFSGNSVLFAGSGFYSEIDSVVPVITNSIFWNHNIPAIEGTTLPIVRRSIVERGFNGGVNVIDADPLFIDSNGPDDIVGTFDDDLRLGVGSPAIDAGSNGDVPIGIVKDLDSSPRFNNCAVDIGALEHSVALPQDEDQDGYTDNCDACPGTPPGSIVGNSGCTVVFAPGDCDMNGEVDLADAITLVACALGPGGGLSPGCACLDFDVDGDTDLRDYAVLQLLMADGLSLDDLVDAIVQCANGPNEISIPANCTLLQAALADFDGDGDVDLLDYAILQRTL